MCIFCALQKLSQVVPAMLPWLVAPLLSLWAASQLLPPPLRFEVTPSRLACGVFLLAVLFWYQFLMPHLLTWRARRSAELQERRRYLAVELHRLRQAAVRRCRNCFTEYRDQNPAGGKFMCCYCGHVSKRPVFDLPGSPGVVDELVGKEGLMCKGSWVAASGDRSSADKPCARKLFSSVSSSIMWVCGRLSAVAGTRGGDGCDADGKDSGKEESREDYAERKGEKARRKAEEKRQARLEKELQEEEERKQREEVFRLIEEQRKLRDEKLEAGKDELHESGLERAKDGRRDSTEKRNDKRKEKDRGSSKGNSDAEEPEKRVGKEGERKFESEKKMESDRIGVKKLLAENGRKGHSISSETPQVVRGATDKSRSIDRGRGLSSPNSTIGFSGTNTLGKTVQNAVPPSKPSKAIGWSTAPSCGQHSLNENDLNAPNAQSSVVSDQPQPNVWKNKMHMLFKNSVAVSSSPSVIPTAIAPPNSQTMQTFDAQPSLSNSSTQIAQTLPFSSHPYIDCSIASNLASLVSQGVPESLPSVEEFNSGFSEEGDFFDDPCYEPDPVELLGPVCESLDNFPADIGCGFVCDGNLKGSQLMANTFEDENITMNMASSLSFPTSLMEIPGTKQTVATDFPRVPKVEDSRVPQVKSNIANEHRIWQMWGPSLIQNPLDIIGDSASWLLPIEENGLKQNAVKHLPSFHTSPNVFQGRVLSGTDSPLLHHHAKYPNGDSIAIDACITDSVPWMEKPGFPKLTNGAENIVPPLKLQETAGKKEASLDSPNRSASGPSFEPSLSKEDSAALFSMGQEDGGRAILPRPCIGGLFSNDSHVQSSPCSSS